MVGLVVEGLLNPTAQSQRRKTALLALCVEFRKGLFEAFQQLFRIRFFGVPDVPFRLVPNDHRPTRFGVAGTGDDAEQPFVMKRPILLEQFGRRLFGQKRIPVRQRHVDAVRKRQALGATFPRESGVAIGRLHPRRPHAHQHQKPSRIRHKKLHEPLAH
jgi:hypothetical protein